MYEGGCMIESLMRLADRYRNITTERVQIMDNEYVEFRIRYCHAKALYRIDIRDIPEDEVEARILGEQAIDYLSKMVGNVADIQKS
jgi:hypothetical protein